jgi:hypothetical protein
MQYWHGPTYISPVTYETYTCPQLAEDAQRVSSRAAQAAGVQDQKATNDKVAMGVGLIIFWPALLLRKATTKPPLNLPVLRAKWTRLSKLQSKSVAEFHSNTRRRQLPSPRIPNFPALISLFARH